MAHRRDEAPTGRSPSPVALFWANAEGRWTDTNEAWCRLARVSAVESTGAGWVQAIHTLDQEAVLEAWRACVTSGSPFQHDARLAHGMSDDVRWVRIAAQPGRLDRGEGMSWSGVVTDITGLRALQSQHERLQTRLAESQRVARLGSWEWTIPTGELWWSAEVYRLFGVDADTFTPSYTRFLGFIAEADRARVEQAVQGALAGDDYSVVHRIDTPDGRPRWMHERGSVTEYRDGEPYKMVGTVQDITERRELERQDSHRQKLEAVGRLASGIAHDFNNLIAVVLGTARMMRSAVDPDAPIADDIEDILRAGKKARALTRGLLSVGPRQSLNRQLVDLRTLVRSFERLATRVVADHVTVHSEVATEPVVVRADSAKLEQVVLNLMLNASQACPSGGTIRLSVYTREDAGLAVVAVADNGPGIRPTDLAHIFEPYFTTRPQGTGLGLAGCRAIVEQHNGQIRVESTVGVGTTFYVELPYVN